MKSGLAACVCAGGLLFVPASSVLAAPRSEGATTSHSNSKATASKQLSLEATHMLHEIQIARQAITANEKQQAIEDIDHAMAQRNRLMTLTKAKGQSMVVPLYTELDDTSVLGPMIAARKGKQQPNMSSPITVDDATAQYTFVGLDLDKAGRRLEAARTALTNNNNQAASDSLGAIGDDLIVESRDSDLPLLAARENLGLAASAAKHSKYQEASAALKEASTDVNQYASTNSAKHAEEAKVMRTKIDNLSKTITEHHDTAVGTIEGWWQEVDSWFTRKMDS